MNSNHIISSSDRVLVTGSNGFIGAKVVQILFEYGLTQIRCFVRPSSKLDRLEKVVAAQPEGKTAEIISGDLLSREDCRRAAEGVSVLYHLAAGMEKSFAGAFMNSALATRNLMDAFREHGRVARFVNVSSFAVYSNLNLPRGALLDETCPLENAPQDRNDAYCFGKLKQEELVRQYAQQYQLPCVILRPGAVFGPGKPSLSGRVGIDTFGFFLHLGGRNQLPLTYVDNCAEAIVLAGLQPGVDGEVFNVVDDELPTSAEFFAAYKSKVKGFFSINIPFFATRGLCCLWEDFSKRRQGQLPPVFNRRRCAAEWKGNCYSNRKLHERLGWKPRVDMSRAMAAFLSQYDGRPSR
ncbi:MAG: NAD(P)-dependent oxidoreductase [Verrucomicrobiota bacterium]|jgi:nucleoside-diphosphate-sugar epimerase